VPRRASYAEQNSDVDFWSGLMPTNEGFCDMQKKSLAVISAAIFAIASYAANAFELEIPVISFTPSDKMASIFKDSCIQYLGKPGELRADAVKSFGYKEFPASTVYDWEKLVEAHKVERVALGNAVKTQPHILLEPSAKPKDQTCELMWVTLMPISVGGLFDAVEAKLNIKLERLSMEGAPEVIRNNRHGCADTKLSGRAVKLCVDEMRHLLNYSISVTLVDRTD
jgi:hypothetical protein